MSNRNKLSISIAELATCNHALTAQELAEILGVTPLTVYRLATQHRIPGAFHVGTALRFNPRAVAKHYAIA